MMRIIRLKKAPCGECLVECLGMGWAICESCAVPVSAAKGNALLAHQPTQSVSNSTLQSRIIAAIHDLAATKPEAGEDWENWYIAAMDLLPGRVAEIFERAKGSGNAE